MDDVPSDSIRRAETSFFASNILLVLIHGCSRASTVISLWRVCQSTPSSKFAITISFTIVAWSIASIVGLVVRRAVGEEFWRPVGADCNFALWASISLSGLAIDVAMAACALTFIAGLQMAVSKKIYALLVFGAGICTIIPNGYGLAYLHRHVDEIARDASISSAPFVNANQAAIAVAVWTRAFETARKLQQDMGYASCGLASFSASDYIRGTQASRTRAFYAGGSKHSRTAQASASRPRRTVSEDELRLRPRAGDDRISIMARDGTDATGVSVKSSSAIGGINVRQEFGWSVDDSHSER
ncbi:uncharacterized protein LTR77_002486 [Saxophila tyrrhenica]|uniref:Rhodopsin domain-containing protein n=1 Tax=Saxophila tyrrhenica TaxID=1690608 RepID=A0AAV9PM53_9PEZI|nr:hypothetical protein LTR77_002486 [Saxophila tyrrhenica]